MGKNYSQLLEFKKEGIFCPLGDFYIDPWKPVAKALITHAHADHARWGHSHYLGIDRSEAILKQRLGAIHFQGIAYGKTLRIGEVDVSFHPAGHVPGSAQICIRHPKERAVVTGDYKIEDDGLSEAFEPVTCDVLLTESTFGLPVYDWPEANETAQSMLNWWQENAERNICSVIFAYSLGKAQRILKMISDEKGDEEDIFLHGAIHNSNEALRLGGYPIGQYQPVNQHIPKEKFRKALVIAPPSAQAGPWLNKFTPYRSAMASGWMSLRGARSRRAVDRGFIISDHADWKGLNQAIDWSGAEKVMVGHGYTAVFARWLCEKGIQAIEVETLFEGESE